MTRHPPTIRLRIAEHSTTLVAALAILVAACGGGEGSTPPPTPKCVLTGVAVTPATSTVAAGDNVPVSAAVAQSNCSTTNVSWSTSAPTIAGIAGSGTSATVTAIAQGSATITATATTEAGNATGTMQITVGPAAVATIVIDPPAKTSIAVAEELQLAATSRDSRGNVLTGRTPTWSSSNNALATVSSSGRVTGVAAGTVNITATVEGKASAPMAINITTQAVASIDVTPQVSTVEVSRTIQLTATPRDAAGNAIAGQTVQWNSANAAVATVSNTGVVTGVAVSTSSVTILASVGARTGQALINVTPATTASIEISPATLPRLVAQDTVNFTAATTDAKGNAISRPLTWASSNASVATISTTGRLIATGVGTTTITATADAVSKTYTVSITKMANSERLAYAVADQSTSTTEYDATAAAAYNGSGGPVKVLRTAVGRYRVRFMRLQGSGASHNMLVSAIGSSSVHCVGSGLGLATGSLRDLDAQVMCRNVQTGADADATFSIVVLGDQSLAGPFAMFSVNPGFSGGFYAWTSAGQPQSAAPSGNTAAVKYGLPIATGDAYLAFATPYFATDVCRSTNRVGDLASFQCRNAADLATTTGFYSVLIGQGRAGKRFGMVWNDQPTQASYVPTHAWAKNSANGLISISRTGTGVYAVTFGNLGSSPKVGVIVNSVGSATDPYRLCNLVSLGIAGGNLTSTIACRAGNNSAADSQFYLLVVE
jgi:uncharacterized protein YjdB